MPYSKFSRKQTRKIRNSVESEVAILTGEEKCNGQVLEMRVTESSSHLHWLTGKLHKELPIRRAEADLRSGWTFNVIPNPHTEWKQRAENLVAQGVWAQPLPKSLANPKKSDFKKKKKKGQLGEGGGTKQKHKQCQQPHTAGETDSLDYRKVSC